MNHVPANQGQLSEAEIEKFLKKRDRLAKRLGKKLKGFDSVKAIREMREKGKW